MTLSYSHKRMIIRDKREAIKALKHFCYISAFTTATCILLEYFENKNNKLSK